MENAQNPPAPAAVRLSLSGNNSVATLAVAADTPPGMFASVANALRARGMTTAFDVAKDGSYLLHIHNFAQESAITSALAESGIQPEITHTEDGQYEVAQWLKDHTLKTSGFLYLLGDASLFLSGYLSGRSKEAVAGLLYASGGAVSALYGNPSLTRSVKNVAVRMGDFLGAQGANIPPQSALSIVMSTRRGGLMERIEQFLYRHPSEIHNLIYAYGSTKLLQSGLAKHAAADPAKRAGWWEDMAAGGLVTGGGLIGGLVGEKQGEENKSTNNIWRWVTEKPLRLAGYLYTLNNVFLVKGAWREMKENPAQHSYVFKFMTAAFFLMANTFLSLTSRTHSATGKESEDMHHLLEGMAAEVIAAQPPEARPSLIRQAAGFLSAQPETKQDLQMVQAAIAGKVAAFSASPWHKAAPVLQSKEPKAPSPSWQEKLRAATPAPAISL